MLCASARAPRPARSISTASRATRAPRRWSAGSGWRRPDGDDARRSKTDVSVRAEDADPFRFRSWLFGSISDVERCRVRGRARARPREHARRSCAATSAACRRASTSSICSSRSCTTPACSISRRRRRRRCTSALRNSLAFVDRLLVSSGSPSLKIALAATNGRCFVATGCAYPDALPPRRGHLGLPGLPRRQRPQRSAAQRPAHSARGAARGRRRGQP